MNSFSYLLEKIKAAEIVKCPFELILIQDFLQKDHFEEIINLTQIPISNQNLLAIWADLPLKK